MTKFRPCIDLHQGQVKQIIGGTLNDATGEAETNFVSDQSAAYFAAHYQKDALTGGHVIQLGPGNETAARDALAAYPGGLQIGGGVHLENAASYLDAGASHVIVTSMLFDPDGHFQETLLQRLVAEVGKGRLVLDLSCRRTEDGWCVAMNRWQKLTDLAVTEAMLQDLASYADEFLIHAADVEGRCQGIDEALVERLGQWSPLPMTYAGGARSMEDLVLVDRLSSGKVDLTIGSAIDLFGGSGASYAECVDWNAKA
ncbi:MAG: phosphoribosylformimino-5-aminoimidazole carboxamide ribotide isomerase [Verrucomicrobiales bacterium]|jgi:phosphoribosylformimino-5-aminoimidazole carboxamide ribotide isomerase